MAEHHIIEKPSTADQEELHVLLVGLGWSQVATDPSGTNTLFRRGSFEVECFQDGSWNVVRRGEPLGTGFAETLLDAVFNLPA